MGNGVGQGRHPIGGLPLLSQYQASPREGHLEQIMHIFAFLRKKPKLSIYLDPSLPNIEYGDFRTKREDFAEQYRGAEALRSQCPTHHYRIR
jgi:hypothetical protein